jgi:hypothetical protein
MNPKLIYNLKFISGISMMVLNVGVWINGLFIQRERGMDIIASTPLLVIGVFLLSGWYKTAFISKPLNSQRWKFILNVFLVNYLTLYFIYLISDIIFLPSIDLMSIPGVILPILLCLFITGFILSWKYELYAGICFLLWYLLVLFGQFSYSELLHRGPYILLGLTILLHGILYLYFYFKIKRPE